MAGCTLHAGLDTTHVSQFAAHSSDPLLSLIRINVARLMEAEAQGQQEKWQLGSCRPLNKRERNAMHKTIQTLRVR